MRGHAVDRDHQIVTCDCSRRFVNVIASRIDSEISRLLQQRAPALEHVERDAADAFEAREQLQRHRAALIPVAALPKNSHAEIFRLKWPRDEVRVWNWRRDRLQTRSEDVREFS